MTLRELQLRFASALFRGEPGPLVQAVRGEDAAMRVDVYRDMYRLRLLDVLSEVYERTRGLLGDAWEELADTYVRRHPSRTPSLREYGSHFASMLGGEAASLAALEWARYDIFDAVDEPLLTREEMKAGTSLQRIAASVVLPSEHDAYALWEGEPSRGPSTLLVWREGIAVNHRRIDRTEAELLALVEGSTLTELCDVVARGRAVEAVAQEIFAYVGRWLADGLLTSSPAQRRLASTTTE